MVASVSTQRKITRRQFIHSASAAGIYPLIGSNSYYQSDNLQLDGDGLIVHRNVDGGDTAQREGWYWFGMWFREKILNLPSEDQKRFKRDRTVVEVMDLLEPRKDGIFYRHPKLYPWNNPFDKKFGFSRDQMIPLVAAMGVYGMDERVRRLWNKLPQDPVGGTKHTFNGSLRKILWFKAVYTGDIVGPMTINLFRRAWNENPLIASDGNGSSGEQELARNVDLRIAASLTNRDNTGDDLNLIVMLLMALIRNPSDTARSAAQRYAKNRGVSYGSFLSAYRDRYGNDMKDVTDRMNAGIKAGWKTDCSRVLGAIRWYYRAETGANPILANLYEPIVRQYLE